MQQDRVSSGDSRRARADLPYVLAHELAHALWGPAWTALPAHLQESLADWTAIDVYPQLACEIGTKETLEATGFLGPVRLVRTATAAKTIESKPTAVRVQSTLTVVMTRKIKKPLRLIADVLESGRNRLMPKRNSGARPGFTGLGWILVSSIGRDGLLEMCRRVEVNKPGRALPKRRLVRGPSALVPGSNDPDTGG